MTRFYYLFFLTLSAFSQLSIADEGFSISAGGMLFWRKADEIPLVPVMLDHIVTNRGDQASCDGVLS